MAQQESRRDLDVELGDALSDPPDIPPFECLCASCESIVRFPALQQRFLKGEEDAFSIQLQCGKPSTLARDVRRHGPPPVACALKPIEHHDFLQLVDRNQP